MRFRSTVSEAWRNLATGTTHALTWALLLMVTGLAFAVIDARTIVLVSNEAHQWRTSGASTQIFEDLNNIDPHRCDALARTQGVNATGAVRKGDDLRFLNLPSNRMPVYEATPQFLELLAGKSGQAGGLWLSADIAKTLGAKEGDVMQTDRGPAQISGVYDYPEDGRDRTLGYAVIAPVQVSGNFDQCWADIWPTNEHLTALLRSTNHLKFTLRSEATLKQLNPRLGANFNAHREWETRLTSQVAYGALAAGLVIGYLSLRTRRLELAAALHARVRKSALAVQTLVETIYWTTAAVLIAAPVMWIAAAVGNPEPPFTVWVTGMRVVGVAAVSVWFGALVAVFLTREKHLFKYFKDR